MSVFSDNIDVIITAVTGAVSGVFLFFKGKKARESNANIEIGKAYELMSKQNNAFIITMTDKIDKQTKRTRLCNTKARELRKRHDFNR